MPPLSLTAVLPCARRAAAPAPARGRQPAPTPLRAAPAAASRPRRVAVAVRAEKADNAADKTPAPEQPPRRGVRSTLSGVGRWLAQAAAEIFSPVDDHGADFKGTLMPYGGTPLSPSDHRRLARVEQVVARARAQLGGEKEQNDNAGAKGEGGGGAREEAPREEGAPDLGALPARDALALRCAWPVCRRARAGAIPGPACPLHALTWRFYSLFRSAPALWHVVE
jgi:hypothetical protein